MKSSIDFGSRSFKERGTARTPNPTLTFHPVKPFPHADRFSGERAGVSLLSRPQPETQGRGRNPPWRRKHDQPAGPPHYTIQILANDPAGVRSEWGVCDGCSAPIVHRPIPKGSRPTRGWANQSSLPSHSEYMSRIPRHPPTSRPPWGRVGREPDLRFGKV